MTKQEVVELFDKKRDKVKILWEALDHMQSYNGRSKLDCLALAMGVDIDED